MLDSAIRVDTKYYPQTLLKECKYVIKKNKMENLITYDFDLSSSDGSDNESDSEPDREPDSEPDGEPGNKSDNDKSND